jgi:hypothetical protein
MESPSLFTIELPISKEYEVVIDRFLEIAVLFATIHIMVHVAPATAGGLFGPNFWQMLLFAAIGVGAYQLVVKKFVRFTCVGGRNQRNFSFREWIKSKL